MANTIWKEVFLIMCSSSWENARNTERFPKSLRITDDYALAILCGEQHNICNEEGKLIGLAPNRVLKDDDGNAVDIIFGTFIITGLTEDDFSSLTDEQAKYYLDIFEFPELILRTGNGFIAVKIEE